MLIIASIALLFMLTLVVQAHLRKSVQYLRNGPQVWDVVYSNCNKLLDERVPPEVRHVAAGLAMTTGCGCYVRSILIEHYLPALHRATLSNKGRIARDETAAAFKSLTQVQRKQFDLLLSNAIAFDMLANPLQGRLLRHAMAKRFANQAATAVPSPSKAEREAVILTAVRKQPDLCAA